MQTTGNTILITGGGTGIGLALARVFLRENNDVIICGRREQKLLEAKNQFPRLHTRICDVSEANSRKTLVNWTIAHFGNLNILVNNAGIQREIDFKTEADDRITGENEIEINLQAPVHLSALFIPHLLKQPEAAIINVSSGLGFVPIARMPVYCATKAALHSFSISLRHQLKDTAIKVFEIIPPTVDTELDKGTRDRRGQTDRGIPPGEVAEATLQGIAGDDFEIAVGQAQFLKNGARNDPEGIFRMLNSH